MKLNIPAQTDQPTETLLTLTHSLGSWVEELDTEDLGGSTRKVYELITQLNHTLLDDRDRFDAMESLRGEIRFILEHLKDHFMGQTLPLSESNQRITNLNQSILREIATAYKIIIRNAADDAQVDDGLLAAAICRSIRYQSEILLRTSQVYAQIPDGTWHDLHAVFDFAKKRGLNDLEVSDNEVPAGRITIENAYKQALLFFLGRPNGLRQTESEMVFQMLSDWSDMALLSDDVDPDRRKQVFCIHVHSDEPPFYLMEQDCDGRDHIITLDTTRLVEHIKELIIAIDPSECHPDDKASLDTLNILAYSWGAFAERRSDRSEQYGHISAAIGMKSAARAIRKEERIMMAADPLYIERRDQARDRLNRSLESISTDKDIDPELTFQDPSPLLRRGDFQLSSDVDLNWAIVNVSAGGYCLRWNSEQTSRAQIGEVIALRERRANGTYRWCTGIIRWMQYTSEFGLEIGVQLLAPDVHTASITTGETVQDCLILPGNGSSGFPTSILLPEGHGKGDRIELQVLGEIMEIELADVIERTLLFSQFTFSRTERDIELCDEKESEKLDDFHDLWSIL